MKNQKGIEYIRALIARGESVLRQIEESGRAPNNKKVLERRWSLKEAAELVDRSSSSLLKIQNQLINEGLLDNLEKYESTNRISGYTLKQINQFRTHFKTFPRRDISNDNCLTLAIQTFKGGVGKSVTSVAVAQYFATMGYRVLFIDMDSQASSTSSFGYIPDRDIADCKTLLPYFRGEEDSLHYCIRQTYWEGLDIIPSNLQLYNIELGIAEQIRNLPAIERNFIFTELSQGINTVKDAYDLVIIDSPPALGFTSINILCAVDSIVIPTPPALYEFSSTVQYLKMIGNVVELINPEKEYNFIKILATDVFPNQTNHREFLPIMQDVFGYHMMSNYFLHTTEIGNAAIDFQTPLEVRRPQKRALNIINSFCREIETEVWKTWPSKHKKLEKEGKFVLKGESSYA